MSKVFVIDTNYQPLNPVHPGRARLLLKEGNASVYRMYPFTLILKAEVRNPEVTPLRMKLDPGSKTTGIAVVNDASGEVAFAAELSHRGQTIKDALEARRRVRRKRRYRKTRYRPARFNNRKNKKQGCLPPSLESRIANILTWVSRCSRYCSITAISMELVKFDLQKMENPEISGIEYQQGTLLGYEIREYLLEKWNRQCVYCGARGVPLQVEHMCSRARGGTNRISNLCLACEKCNTAKGTLSIEEFLKKKPDVLARVLAQAKAPLKDAAAVNVTRWALHERFNAMGLPVECGSGGLTKWNRTTRGLPKEHWLDACCVGRSTPEQIVIKGILPLSIKAMGHGRRQMCLMDRFGFPRTAPKAKHFKHGFRTGDMVRAVVPTHLKHAGTHVGRIAAKANGAFTIATSTGTVTDIGKKHCRLLQRADGYSYTKRGEPAFPPAP